MSGIMMPALLVLVVLPVAIIALALAVANYGRRRPEGRR